MTIRLDLFQTAAVAALVYLIGVFLSERITQFKKFFIPAPVVGGLLFSLFALSLNLLSRVKIETDTTLQTVFMMLFFASVGYTASFRMLKKGGLQVLLFSGLAALMILLQNGVGMGMASLFDLDPLMGLCLGSIPLVGGHGTAGSFGPMIEETYGLSGASTAAAAAATFGLVAGSLIGGPAARIHIRRMGLTEIGTEGKPVAVEKEDQSADKASMKENLRAFSLLIISAGLGTTFTALIGKLGVVIPAHVGAMVAAAILRNILDLSDRNFVEDDLVGAFGNISLALFLSMALMGLRLWELADMALPMITILLVQTICVFLFSCFAVYYLMGRDYEAAVMSSATCGFGMGATPNAIANMQALTTKYGPAHKAFFIVPLVGSLFVDFINTIVVTTILMICG